jgi:hypothetical protein
MFFLADYNSPWFSDLSSLQIAELFSPHLNRRPRGAPSALTVSTYSSVACTGRPWHGAVQ